FFFSSRRRHTRFSRDWSSDVCSSDLRTSSTGDDADPGIMPPKIHVFLSNRTASNIVRVSGSASATRFHCLFSEVNTAACVRPLKIGRASCRHRTILAPAHEFKLDIYM